jgi:hypothetical protein
MLKGKIFLNREKVDCRNKLNLLLFLATVKYAIFLYL